MLIASTVDVDSAAEDLRLLCGELLFGEDPGVFELLVFSADETTDIGRETGTTVASDCTAATSRFNGKIHWVQIDLGDDDHDHLIDDDERLRIAMARQ